MATPSTLEVHRDAGIVTVTLNRPHRKNAINAQCWVELEETFDEIRRSNEDRAVVVTGAGGNFCTGADLSENESGPRTPAVISVRRMNEVALRLHRLTIPTIAKVDGMAVGYGVGLAAGCDLVVASERAKFSAIFVRRGLVLDGGTSWLLPRLIGLQKAKELAFFGEMVSAPDAVSLGLVNRVVSVDELDAFVDGWARRLATGPTMTLGLTKSMLNNSFSNSMDEAMEEEARCQHIAASTSDTTEALRAFLEKREPNFRGR